MFTITYGTTQLKHPTPTLTQLTTYMWPGFIGEWDEQNQTFDVWELVNNHEWRKRDDILSPPQRCLGIDSQKGYHWNTETSIWTVYASGWRLACSAGSAGSAGFACSAPSTS